MDKLLNLRAIGARATEVAIRCVWAQWAALGAAGAGASRVNTVIDPEALLLATLALREDERRLDDVLVWWAAGGSRYLSTGRAGTLAAHFPGVDARPFAAAAVQAGDARWVRLAGDANPLEGRTGKGGDVRLQAAPALWLRLRTLLGVGVKADVLTRLLTGRAAAVSDLSEALAYTPSALRSALDDLATGDWIAARGRPRTYRVEGERWQALLGGPVSEWHPWAGLLAALLAVRSWSKRYAGALPYVAATHGWDVAESHASALEATGVAVRRASGRDEEVFTGNLAEVLTAWIGAVELL